MYIIYVKGIRKKQSCWRVSAERVVILMFARSDTKVTKEQEKVKKRRQFLIAAHTQMKKRKSYTGADKLEAIKKVQAGENRFHICKLLNITTGTLSQWLTKSERIEQQVALGSGHLQKARLPDYPELDRCMFAWSNQMRQAGAPLTEEIYRHKAMEFAVRLGMPDFTASAGWVRGFKERHALKMKVIMN